MGGIVEEISPHSSKHDLLQIGGTNSIGSNAFRKRF